jgi:hypothetical protein
MMKGMQYFVKIAISAILIFVISEVSKRNSVLGAVIGSLPLVSILAMIWLYHDTGDAVKIAAYSRGVFWLVLPSLILFALLPPLLMRWHFSFPIALLLAMGATAVAYGIMLWILGLFGISV